MASEGEFEGFRIEEVLSRSGTTTVYRAFQHSLQRTVLIKELHPEVFREKDILGRFQREAQVCALIKHENIVDIYDYTVRPDRIFLVMEYVFGCSLADLIQKTPQLPIDLILAIMVQTLRGLSYAHSKGVIHRDIKPSNILISRDGWVKITDFGLALLEGSAIVTQPGAVVGTPAYISPEAISGGAITSKSDLFSLGATFYELCTGQRIFHADHFSDSLKKVLTLHPAPPSQLRADLSPELDRIILRMLEKQPPRRWPSATEIAEAVESLELTVSAGDPKLIVRRSWQEPEKSAAGQPTPTPIRRFRTQKQRRNMAIGIAALLLVIIAVSAYLIASRQPSEEASGLADQSQLLKTTPPDTAGLTKLQPAKTNSTQLLHKREASTQPPATSQEAAMKEAAKGEQLPAPSDTSSHLSKSQEIFAVRKSEARRTPEPAEIITSAEPAILIVRCDPWADVYLDDIPLDRTPFAAQPLTPGRHKLSFQHPAFAPVVIDTIFYPGKEISISVNFWDNVGRIMVIAHPWAKIYVDNNYQGDTPLNEPLIVPLGEHNVRLENPAFQQWEKSVFFQRGDPPCTLKVDLQPIHGSLSPLEPPAHERTDSARFSGNARPAGGDSLQP